MKHLLLIVSGICLAPLCLLSQQIQREVLAIGGSSFQSSIIHINATIGEPVIGSKSLDNLYYSQGFQQADKLGCSFSPSVTSLASVSCPGGDDGWLKVVVTGGIGPFTFLWQDGDGNQDRLSVGAGIYSVTVSDAIGCSATVSTFIEEPDSFSVQIDTIVGADSGQQNGKINVTTAGGTPPYSFDWKGPNGFSESTEDIDSLGSGTYELVVTDSNGCDGIFSLEVEMATGFHQPAWLQEITYWPNPVRDKLYIDFPTGINGRLDIQIYDVLGRQIVTQTNWNVTEMAKISLVDVSPGLLQVVFYWREQVGSIKLIHQP